MFVSHQQSLHHTSGSHPSSTHVSQDPTKAHSLVFPVSSIKSSSFSSTTSSQPAATRTSLNGISQSSKNNSFFAGQQQAGTLRQPQQTTTSFARSFTSSGIAATSQSRFASNNPTPPNGHRAAPAHFATSSPSVANSGQGPSAHPNASGGSTTGAFNKNSPAVKFLVRKPARPAAISSSAALYHFSSSNGAPKSSGVGSGAQGSTSNTSTSSLAKYSIPKVSHSSGSTLKGVNGVHSAANGNLASFPSSSSSSGKHLSTGSTLPTVEQHKHRLPIVAQRLPCTTVPAYNSHSNLYSNGQQTQQQEPPTQQHLNELAFLKYQQQQQYYVCVS